MKRIVIVSNRLPVSVSKEEGGIQVTPSVGGLATGMKSVYKGRESLWLGWPGIDRHTLNKRELGEVDEKLQAERCKAIYLEMKDVDGYYYGFSNKTIWPLFHYFPQYTEYHKPYWETYRKVNRQFAEEVGSVLRPGDSIWIHDYQLLLLPKMIKEAHPDVTVGFFNHIPFPSFEIFRLLPWRSEILQGMLGADLIGFHSYDYERHFSSCVRRLLGYDYELNLFHLGDRIIRADSFPMGIDYQRFRDAAEKINKSGSGEIPELQKAIERFHQVMPDRKLILSIDRMDYSKGIPNRLHAFREFLETNPSFHGKVSMVMLTVPSRSNVEQYQLLRREVDELVGKINGTYGDLNWTPVWYFYRSMPFEDLVLLYHFSDVALITPIRDGMNLVAKEFMATKTDGRGVLILSEMAGSAKEMNEAIIINPNNREEIASAIRKAIEMPAEEQLRRNEPIRIRIERNSVERWAEAFFRAMQDIRDVQTQYRSKRMDARVTDAIAKRFDAASRKVLFLDYNGTLVDYRSSKDYKAPDAELYALLEPFTGDPAVDVVLISSRDKDTLQGWFPDDHIVLFAEHGLWKRNGGTGWHSTSKPLDTTWKKVIRPVLESYVDRTPGSRVEELNNILSWHYDQADPDHGTRRARDLKDELTARIRNMDLQIIDGSKTVEVKPSSMNKGVAARNTLGEKPYDFIMAIGNDWTDESMFEALPPDALTVRVGIKKTLAKFTCESYRQVRQLLHRLGREVDVTHQ